MLSLPADCSWFYECVDGLVVGHIECPDGLLWNQDLLTCDRDVKCNIDGTRSEKYYVIQICLISCSCVYLNGKSFKLQKAISNEKSKIW